MRSLFLYAATFSLLLVMPAQGQIVSPVEFLGHEAGADFKLARWETITAYFELLNNTSDRVQVETIGTSTGGNPYIMATISTPETLANLDTHKKHQRWLSHPNEMPEDKKQEVLNNAKSVVLVNCAIHSSEIGSSQMAMELAYNLATTDDEHTRNILENCIILLVPSANPDGINIVIDWYERSLGEPWEGSGRPWLYQKYTGHDNNRDWFMLTQKETRILNRVLYHEWYPSILYDVHQMGNSGMRFFVPPFYDPMNPNIDPLIGESLKMIGGHMSAALAAEDKKGVASNAIYDMWWHGGTRTAPYRHNIIGILTEAASPRVASPIFQTKSDLSGHGRGLNSYQKQINFADPWPGGWWRLRDVVEYELIASNALFELAAKYRQTINRNYMQMAEQAILDGKQKSPFAFIFPLEQHDRPTTHKLLEILHEGGIQIDYALEDFEADGIHYQAGTPIIFSAQPYRNHIMDLLTPQVYPERPRYPGGPNEPPYDVAGWTLSFQMGVDVAPVQRAFEVKTERAGDTLPELHGTITGNGNLYISKNTSTNDFILLNRAWDLDIPVYIAEKNIRNTFDSGSNSVFEPLIEKGQLLYWIPNERLISRFENSARELGLSLTKIQNPYDSIEDIPRELRQLKPAIIGLYQPWTRNMDEGWTRFVLEDFEFDYTTVHNDWIRAGRLHERLDVLILPDISPHQLIHGQDPNETAHEFAGGIGTEGVTHIQEFVENGGVLLCLDTASEFAIKHLNLPVKNTLDDLNRNKFYCPGSILRTYMNTNHPLSYGMPKRAGAFFAHSYAFKYDKSAPRMTHIQKPATAAQYDPTMTLLSGWINGAEYLHNKSAVMSIGYGKGTVVLYGFRVQHRAQPHGTFRLLFNGLSQYN